MTATTVQLRKIVAAAIEANRLANDFVLNDFEVRESYLPQEERKDLPDDGIVYVVAMAKDDTIISRRKSFQSEIPIQIALQFPVSDDQDVDALDIFVELAEQLRKSAIAATSSSEIFAWLRNDALRDGIGEPVHFVRLRDASTFEAYFSAIYQVHESLGA